MKNCQLKVIVCLDTNEEMYKKNVDELLTHEICLKIRKNASVHTSTTIRTNCFHRSKPIDGRPPTILHPL